MADQKALVRARLDMLGRLPLGADYADYTDERRPDPSEGQPGRRVGVTLPTNHRELRRFGARICRRTDIHRAG
jgi:hypothetical protein